MAKLINIDNEFSILPWKNGVCLIAPNQKIHRDISDVPQIYTVDKALHLPMSVYFLNPESDIQILNQNAADCCGFSSIKGALGKSILATIEEKSATSAMMVNHRVAMEKRMYVHEQQYERLDSINFIALSFRYPWYNLQGDIIGVFGFSLVLDELNSYSMSQAIITIANMGLLTSSAPQLLMPGKYINNVYLSNREAECLNLNMKGYSAKKIANYLQISQRTVESHMEHIKRKFKVRSKAELIGKLNLSF